VECSLLAPGRPYRLSLVLSVGVLAYAALVSANISYIGRVLFSCLLSERLGEAVRAMFTWKGMEEVYAKIATAGAVDHPTTACRHRAANSSGDWK